MNAFKTAGGAERSQAWRRVSGYSRSAVVPCGSGWALVLWWGTTSNPTDAVVYGARGRVLASGVEAAERVLGLV